MSVKQQRKILAWTANIYITQKPYSLRLCYKINIFIRDCPEPKKESEKRVRGGRRIKLEVLASPSFFSNWKEILNMTAAVSQELNKEAFPVISIIRKKGLSQEGRRGNEIGWGQSEPHIYLHFFYLVQFTKVY